MKMDTLWNAGMVVSIVYLFGGISSTCAAEINRDASAAVSNLDVADGMSVTLFASEPLLSNPTNIDIDHRGRVWLIDVLNYRKNEGTREEGDRILILEDIDGDGVSDKSTVFYQGTDINSALGIALVGSRVIVTSSPNVIVFQDLDGDDRADSKEYLFTKTGAEQNDHSGHTFVVGPDGRLYWNFGNFGESVHDASGKLVVDRLGNPIIDKGKPYWGGMIFRCELDGSSMETLGHNFRNNYEVSVDSFGDMWQSDNDDDGNQGVRINYILEYGNYGFRDEMTGAGWRQPRTGMAEEIPLRHWHLNDPGVVPNFVQTGGGSPTGIMVYEGRLLPERFWGQVIHCDAGPSVVRAYPADRDGAGFQGDIVPILGGERDGWFRPVDVCAAPDGSIFVSDWYDPTVGGNRQGDLERGRLYRIAPPSVQYEVPEFDFDSIDGAIEALKNPNISVRFLAREALLRMGGDARFALVAMTQDPNPRFRARALWVYSDFKGHAERAIELATYDGNERIRCMALKIARRHQLDVIPVVEQLLHDESPAVRRECSIALRDTESSKVPDLWAKLALQYDGQDRWYLEALGIGAEGRWDSCLEAWMDLAGTVKDTELGRDIIWRSRSRHTLEELGRAIMDSRTTDASRIKYIRALDFQSNGREKDKLLLEMLASENLVTAAGGAERLKRYKFKDGSKEKKILDSLVERLVGTPMLLDIAEAYKVKTKNKEILEAALENPESRRAMRSVDHVLKSGGLALLEEEITGEDVSRAINTTKAMSQVTNKLGHQLLLQCMENKNLNLELRKACLRAVCRKKVGARLFLQQVKTKGLSDELKLTAGETVSRFYWTSLREQGLKLFPKPAGMGGEALPPISELVGMKGDPQKGPDIYAKAGCMACHRLQGQYFEFGPDLSQIGSKLSREALFEAILMPSAAISHGFGGVSLRLKDGGQMVGIIFSETEESITVKMAGGASQTIKKDEVVDRKYLEKSLMPEGLATIITLEELVSLVDYLETLEL